MPDETSHRRDDQFFEIFREHAAIMLLVEPDSGWILEANPAAELFYGYSREQFQKLNIAVLRQASAKEVFGGRHPDLFLHNTADGRIRIVEEHASQIRMEEKDAVFLIIQDQTEQIRVEEALRESEGRFHTML
ncbi:MAG TPA: PAS domain S-box protein, partial [Anaerolineales bacterium]|nr:PAS domain S-box protein [Anaerolineales bacterium]